MRRVLPVLALLLSFCAFAQKRVVNWHHNLSPYRAVFTVKGGGNPQAGALLEVPICGTGHEGGANVFCYSETGKPLLCKWLGIGTQNSALVQVMPDKDSRTVLAYFGSEQRAPVAKFDVPPALCQVYSIKGKPKNWQELSACITPAALLGQFPVEDFIRIGNPVDSREEFAMVLSAKLNITGDCTRNLFITSDDAGYLFIDDKLIIARDGVRNIWDGMHGENHKPVELKQGLHDIRLVGANFGKDFTLVVAEWFQSGNVSHLPKTIYVQPSRTTLLTVETHKKDTPIPVFKYAHISDMPLDNRHLTITEFETYGGEALWTFADGVQLTGAKVRRVFGSLETMKVKVKAGRNTAGGTVMFPQISPLKVESTDNRRSFDEFDGMVSNEMIAGSKTDVLYALMDFYGRRDLHPKQIAVAEALLTKDGLPFERKFNAYLMLARSAAVERPDKALKAYNAILQSPQLEQVEFADMLAEAFEFALYGMRDFELADKMLRRYSQRMQRNRKALLALQFDLASQQGKTDEALRLYQELLKGRTKAEERRTAAVQGNSIQANVAMLLSQGKVFEAEASMRDWIAASPQDRTNGSYSLERARCFRMRGWGKGAIGELTAAIQADALLPNLPDVEYELALAYSDIGEKEKANELFTKISKEYPNHRLAAEARKRIGK